MFKNDDATSTDNYRPILVVDPYCKISEKYLFDTLNNHLKINNIISNYQYGFIEHSNTMAACIDLTYQISTAIANKLYVACIFLDLSKAFNTVNHSILIQKLNNMGIEKDECALFESYLSNRFYKLFL